MKKIQKILAFTMAEMLIVIVLIGFLGVIVLNSLSKAQPDKNKVLFKKTYSVIEKTVQELVNDETLYPYDPNRPGFTNSIAVVIPGGNGTDKASGDTKFPVLIKDKLNVLSDQGVDSGNYKFSTSDGIGWLIPVGAFTRGSEKMITVDVNGFDKGPNTHLTQISDGIDKMDVFQVYVNFDGKVNVKGDVEQYFLLSHSTKAKDEDYNKKKAKENKQ